MNAASFLNRRQSRRVSAVHLLRAILLMLLAPSGAGAQFLNGTWNTTDAGGGDAGGGLYTLRGTIGQPDAGPPLGAGAYDLESGFWRGADALYRLLIFADGFELGTTGSWDDSAPLLFGLRNGGTKDRSSSGPERFERTSRIRSAIPARPPRSRRGEESGPPAS